MVRSKVGGSGRLRATAQLAFRDGEVKPESGSSRRRMNGPPSYRGFYSFTST